MVGRKPSAASHELSEADHPVLRFAREEAIALGHPYVGTEHLLLALLRAGDPEVVRSLSNVGIATDALRTALLETLPSGEVGGISPTADLPYTSRTRTVLRLVDTEPRSNRSETMTGMHFLRAILKEDENIAAQVLYKLGMPGQQNDPSSQGLQGLAQRLELAGLRWKK